VQVEDLKVLKDLINLPKTLFLFTLWVVPTIMKDEVQSIVEQAKWCLGNLVVEQSMLPHRQANS